MRFSDWQLNRLRDALRAYHRYGRDPVDKRFYNWKDVSEGIAESTEVEVSPERLRQFVEGVKTADGGRKYPAPQETTLNAIVAFVTHEDNDLLSDDELREHTPDRHAALRLLEYLGQAFDTVRILPPATLEGTYRNWLAEDYGLTICEITLQRASDDGLIQLVQTEDTYGPEAISSYEEWSPLERKKARKSRTVYGGWGILTPEDNLLLFLKHEHNGRNRYYLTMASQLSHASQIPVKGLALLHHDFPVEVDETATLGPETVPAVRAALDEKLVIFRRID